MDKLDMQTANIADKNFETLSKLFPNALTETINENGEVVRAIDADILRQEISCSVVEGKDERYQFCWPDKREAIVLSNKGTSNTLRPNKEDSVNFDTTENLYIEGDNLEVLKILQETYLNKIDLIYIDPPYNTGHDFVYEDDFTISKDEYIERSGQADEKGNRLVQNNETNGRFHTDWLNMIYSRLRLAKNLLSDKGAIFISIDDNELCNLEKVCDEVFGSSCFVACISWQKTYSPRNNNQGIASEVEYVLIYSKNAGWVSNRLPRTEEMNSKYKNPDNDVAEWRNDNPSAPGAATHQGMVYAIQHPFTGEMMYPPQGRCWCREQSFILENMQKWAKYKLSDIGDDEKRAEICGVGTDAIRKNVESIILDEPLESAQKHASELLEKGPWPMFYFSNNGKGSLTRKSYITQVADRTPTNLWKFEETGHTDEAKKELKEIFGGDIPFDTPKPVRLIERIIDVASNQNSIVMDFFSGSSTTAHAVLKKNMEDNGKRKFIMVQIPEESNNMNYSNLCEVGKERIRLVGSKYSNSGIDYGFRVLKLDTSNMKDIYYRPNDTQQTFLDMLADNIKPDRTPEDLLFQVMLDLGVALSSKIEEMEICEKKVFDVEDGFLIACFDKNITEETVTAIAQKKPYYAVFRDGSMANDSVATNFDQLFETYSPDTVRKVL